MLHHSRWNPTHTEDLQDWGLTHALLLTCGSCLQVVFDMCLRSTSCVFVCAFRCCSGVCESWSVWSCLRCRAPWWGWSVQDDSWSLKRSKTSRFTQTLKNLSAILTWLVSVANDGYSHQLGLLRATVSSSCVWSNQELPEQAYLHPPLTIFVVEHRAFGRLALVGSHVVQSLMNYTPPELGGEPEEEDEKPKPKPNGKSFGRRYSQ